MTKRDLLEHAGVLLVTRPFAPRGGLVPMPPGSNQPHEPDILLAVFADDRVAGFCGHVDLGTGIRTALTQIVAEELDVPLDRVEMVLGHTEVTPDQGPTIASETIQVSAVALRQAAAQARVALLGAAANELEVPAVTLRVVDGVVHGGERRVSYGALIGRRTWHVTLSSDVAMKPPGEYRLVGQPVPRVDIPAKALATFTYVHDVRVPGMLHGRVVRPPYLGHDSGAFVGRCLQSVDAASVDDVPGLVAVVTIGDFVGVVAEREEHADQAMRQLRVTWRPFAPGADLTDVSGALRRQDSTRRTLLERGDVDAALAGAKTVLRRSYNWPYQMHGSIGPSCAVADHAPGRLQVWSGTQNPHVLRADLCRLLNMAETDVDVARLEAAGCYGRNCADDVAGDAALLSRAVGRPVRVQLTREQEHAWEPKGAAQVSDVAGGIDARGDPVAYDFVTRYPSNLAPMLPLLLTGAVPPVADVVPMGDRTAVPPYAYPAMRVAVEDMAPLVRASWFRGVSALPNSFAHECFIDELATEAAVDPVEYRLRYLPDARAADLVRSVAQRVGWEARTGPRLRTDGDIAHGQGFAYAVYVHGAYPGVAAAYAAWAADVAVNRRTGEVTVTRVTVGHDAGLMVNPAGVRHQVHGNVVQTTSRALMEQVQFDERALVTSKEWGAYPIITFRDVPEVDVLMMARPEQPPLGVGESASVPGAAAIANAIFDATGVRFRSAPFTRDVILAGLGAAQAAPRKRRRWAGAAAVLTAALGSFAVWHAALPRATPPGADVFSPALIERGRLLAAAGDCAVCHGANLAGGRGIHTPFGTVYATNITPDEATGIGNYSFPAFQRAMRNGVARDGRNLYPAFPYTAFAHMTDADLLAVYAFVMAQPPVHAAAPVTRLAFPFNLRPLMAGWNLLFHRPAPLTPDPARTAQWNRGAYLVQAVAHCGACHTPRNALGAERRASALAGGLVDGWDAPPLTATSAAPVAWTQQAVYDYLRTGHSEEHGVAAGPMAAVVSQLAALPDADIAAMAEYIAGGRTASLGQAKALAAASWQDLAADGSEGARLFAGACQSCHHDGGGPPVLGAHVTLALTTSLHAARPDNLLRVLLGGIEQPARPELGNMPAFRDSLNDRQMAELTRFLRARFAPSQPKWADLEQTVSRLRAVGD